MSDRVEDYSIPVHRKVIKRELMLGVSKTTLIILFCLTVFMVLGLKQWWFLAVSVCMLLAARKLTKQDEYYVEILLNAVMEPDELNP
jgi:type IV secretory pathway TrbD component